MGKYHDLLTVSQERNCCRKTVPHKTKDKKFFTDSKHEMRKPQCFSEGQRSLNKHWNSTTGPFMPILLVRACRVCISHVASWAYRTWFARVLLCLLGPGLSSDNKVSVTTRVLFRDHDESKYSTTKFIVPRKFSFSWSEGGCSHHHSDDFSFSLSWLASANQDHSNRHSCSKTGRSLRAPSKPRE